MKLSGLHLLLSYQCTFECDHCFVWGSPWQSGTLTLQQLREILRQAEALETVDSIYFEGGEPFLYYGVLLEGVRLAAQTGFRVGIVSNAYWATELADAKAWLEPFVGLVDDLSLSTDLYHYDEMFSRQVQVAVAAAEQLGIPVGTISVAQPETSDAPSGSGQLPRGESAVMYRGRAVAKLAARTPWQPWETFQTCPHEELRDPGRVHVDPLGYLHLCQGLTLGNLFVTPLTELCAAYDPDTHPIISPLLFGGPAELVRHYALPHAPAYADACHLCYTSRQALRGRFPELLTPDQMYGEYERSGI